MDFRPSISPPDYTTTTILHNDERHVNDDEYNGPMPHQSQYRNPFLLRILSRMYVASCAMQLGTEARFTSLVLFHRYIAHFKHSQSNRDNDNKLTESTHTMKKRRIKKNYKVERHHLGTVAAACLFLGCKAQEESRRIRDVINLSHMLDFENDNDGNKDKDEDDNGNVYNDGYEEIEEMKVKLLHKQQASNDDNQQQQHQQPSKKRIIIHEANGPPDLDESYWEAKERIVSTEQSILRLIKFDVSVSQPHRLLVIIFEELLLFHISDTNYGTGYARRSGVLRSAWKKLNDALFYAPALMCGCMELACAALDLALQESVYAHTNNDIHYRWKDCVGVDQHKLEDAKEKLGEASNLLSRIN